MPRKHTYNEYVVLNTHDVELRLIYKKKIVRVLLDKEDHAKVKKQKWVCLAYPKFGVSIHLLKNRFPGQSLQSFLFDNRPRVFEKIPKDKRGRLDYRKKSLLPFARGNHYINAGKNQVELRFYHQDNLVRILLDKEDQSKVSKYTWHCKYDGDRLLVRSGSKSSLHNAILGERRAKIQEVLRDKQGRLDYRKKSLLPRMESYLNRYLNLNKKEMELHVAKKDKAFRIIFDKEDYRLIKTRNWCARSIGNDKRGIFCIQTGISLTQFILTEEPARIKRILTDSQGRLDYRKKTLLSQVASFTNIYRVLNKKEVELIITKKEKEFRVLFDREDHERVKAYHWRGVFTSGGAVIVHGPMASPLTKVILQNQPVRIRQIPTDRKDRLDYRKESLLSQVSSYTNTYRVMNKKEVELRIAKNDRAFRVLFDREDYARVKARRWRGIYTTGGAVIVCSQTGTPLTKVILQNQSVRIRQIPRDSRSRLDYRKKSLLP